MTPELTTSGNLGSARPAVPLRVGILGAAIIGIERGDCPENAISSGLDDVRTILAQAVTRAVAVSPRSVVAIVDREGFVLGVWNVDPQTPPGDTVANAIAIQRLKHGAHSPLAQLGHQPGHLVHRR